MPLSSIPLHVTRNIFDASESTDMTNVLAVLTLAYAAFCVWLTMQAINRQERWAKRLFAVVVFGVPVLYAASLGPMLWLCEKLDQPAWLCHITMGLYPPMFQVMTSDSFIGRWYLSYLELWQPWTL